ncbi:MAG: CpXC domain-containing protein [Bacteroidales bacterium]|nr:CpXC domain-containing protein [Bacteroidales bacterium]
MSKINIQCSSCRETHGIEVYNSVNVGQDPELKEGVRSGSLFLWECPHCGRPNLASYPFLYHDPDRKLMIWLLPDNSVTEAQLKAVSSQLDALEGYTFRRVSDVGSLIEKISIFDADLDDRIIEMAKYVTAMELAEKAGDKASEIMDAPFKFFKMDGADNEITLTYPSEGQMQGVNIGFNVYEDCRGIIQRNKALTDVTGFATVDRAWVNTIIR